MVALHLLLTVVSSPTTYHVLLLQIRKGRSKEETHLYEAHQRSVRRMNYQVKT